MTNIIVVRFSKQLLDSKDLVIVKEYCEDIQEVDGFILANYSHWTIPQSIRGAIVEIRDIDDMGTYGLSPMLKAYIGRVFNHVTIVVMRPTDPSLDSWKDNNNPNRICLN